MVEDVEVEVSDQVEKEVEKTIRALKSVGSGGGKSFDQVKDELLS